MVSSESGEPSGITCTMPVSPVSLGVASGTDATPSTVAISAPRSSMSPTGSVLSMTEPVTMSGPLKPGPKCSAMRSYVTRPGVSSSSDPASGSVSRRPAAGTVASVRSPTITTTVTIGQRVTARTQPKKNAAPVRGFGSRVRGVARCRGHRRSSHRRPIRGVGVGSAVGFGSASGSALGRRHPSWPCGRDRGADGRPGRYRFATTAPAGEAEQGGVSVSDIEHGDGDRDRGGDAHDGEEGDAGDGEAEQRDDHRHRREHHGRARRRRRPARRTPRGRGRASTGPGGGR